MNDTERLDWLMGNISGLETRRLGIIYNDGLNRDDIDAAMTRPKPTQLYSCPCGFRGYPHNIRKHRMKCPTWQAQIDPAVVQTFIKGKAGQ